MNEEIEEIFSVKEISEILKLSTPKIRLLIKQGKLEALNISSGLIRPVWKITKTQLDKFMGGGKSG